MGPCPERTCSLILLPGFFYLLHAKAPFFVLTTGLIAIGACPAKAVEVAFSQLFLANHGRNDPPEAHIAQGRADIVRPPRNHRLLLPLLAAFNALNTQLVLSPHYNTP